MRVSISHSYFTHYIENGILTISISHSGHAIPDTTDTASLTLYTLHTRIHSSVVLYSFFFTIFISLERNNDSFWPDCTAYDSNVEYMAMGWLNYGTQIQSKKKHENHLFLTEMPSCWAYFFSFFLLMPGKKCSCIKCLIKWNSSPHQLRIDLSIRCTVWICWRQRWRRSRRWVICVCVWFVEAIQIK